MFVLAALPSTSVALVIGQSAKLGIKSGIAIALGITLTDVCWVVIVMLGVSALIDRFEAALFLIQLLGGLYLVWFGITMFFGAKGNDQFITETSSFSIFTSFLAGMVLTFGDTKAIIFYASVLPRLVDLPALTSQDIVLIVAITALTVGSVKTLYAILATKIVTQYAWYPAIRYYAHKLAGACLVVAGTYFISLIPY